ncbi:capsular exopolysaccharide synthesis family protein [Bradyrhizobium sp. AZCC 1719]|uniref:Wzz/FepE/Etk N-terminal domain-containing protein n=1 Tax=Bradyrhizobium sp. AZCC 1719 TaxID=3117028 RepID=UPI002FEF9CC9
MLKTNRPDNPVESDAMPPEFRLPTESLAGGVAFIRRRTSLILSTCLITLGVGLLYLIAAVPTFTADAQLVVESKAAARDAASVSTIVESQIAIIKSESIARAVIGKLSLAEDPEFVPENGVLRSMIKSISRLLGWIKPETESGATRYALRSFERKLSAKRVGLTYIIEISFDSVDPDRATQILNTVAETYIADQMDSKYKSVLRNEKWVKDRISELSNEASTAQKALTNYRKNRNDTADSAETVDAGTPASQLTARTQGELRELEAAAESTARTYDNFLRLLRYIEAQQQSSPVLEARLLAEASRPLRASSPKVGVVLGISTIGGALLGVVLGMLRDLSDRSLRTSEQVWKALQIACIGVVPGIKSDGAVLGSLFADSARRHKRALSNPVARKIARSASPIWTITDAPQSRFADSFIEIKLAIDSMNRRGKRNQVIGITSTQADEGKSTVAAALALLMANTGARVILVDCNLRNQSLSAALAPSAELGVLDVMSGAASVRETAWIESTTQLAFLPVGNKSRPIYASEVLASELLDKLICALRQDYEYVIVDLPAVEPFADARAAVNVLDSFIFVIEASRTNADVVKRGLDVIRHENVAGIVLNRAKCDGV